MTTFSGNALCLDRADINTDEIIPARYLTEIDKSALGPHLMEDLELEGFDPQKDLAGIDVLVT
ncbi:MAG: 3-isopropylmalate dehydratase small subunit, partial [Thermodesulfobacteriota bacterium]